MKKIQLKNCMRMNLSHSSFSNMPNFIPVTISKCLRKKMELITRLWHEFGLPEYVYLYIFTFFVYLGIKAWCKKPSKLNGFKSYANCVSLNLGTCFHYQGDMFSPTTLKIIFNFDVGLRITMDHTASFHCFAFKYAINFTNFISFKSLVLAFFLKYFIFICCLIMSCYGFIQCNSYDDDSIYKGTFNFFYFYPYVSAR